MAKNNNIIIVDIFSAIKVNIYTLQFAAFCWEVWAGLDLKIKNMMKIITNSVINVQNPNDKYPNKMPNIWYIINEMTYAVIVWNSMAKPVHFKL